LREPAAKVRSISAHIDETTGKAFVDIGSYQRRGREGFRRYQVISTKAAGGVLPICRDIDESFTECFEAFVDGFKSFLEGSLDMGDINDAFLKGSLDIGAYQRCIPEEFVRYQGISTMDS
jgi:hypothetical protein